MTDGGESGPSPAAGPGGASRGMYAASFASFAACLLYLLWFAGRRVLGDVRRCRCVRLLPAAVFFLLSLSLALRSCWAALRWFYWYSRDDLDCRWMMVVLELPLLLQFIAFSAITLSWVNVHSIVSRNKHSAVKLLVWVFNVALLGMLAGALVGSLVAPTAQERADWTKFDRRQPYHKIYLVMKAAFCLILAVLFTVFGLKLQVRLSGSAHISEKIQRTYRRIILATLVCCFSFAVQALIFGSTTVLYNFMDLEDSRLDAYLYPLVVYTIPGCLSSGAIITIMFDTTVDKTSSEEEEEAGESIVVDSTSSHYSYLESDEPF